MSCVGHVSLLACPQHASRRVVFAVQAAKELLAAGLHLCRTSQHGCSYTGEDPSADFRHAKDFRAALRYGETCFRWADRIPQSQATLARACYILALA
jgi:hypothetical protein